MSILDEDESNFNKDSGIYARWSKVIKEYMPDAKVLVSNCIDVSCYECVGRKHNLRNGCPVCGGSLMDVGIVRKCKDCQSIIIPCLSDTAAVGVSRDMYTPDADDVI